MPNKLHLSAAIAPVVLMLALPGCSKQATGQVAAVVNGDEITLQEVNAEIGNAKLPEGADKDKARNAILQRLVDKRLIEQQAKSEGLDRDPEFLQRQRQVTQALLIQLYAKRAQDTLRVPDQATVSKFIADHPDAFANRQIFTVDQIRFAPPQDRTVLAGLRDAHTIEAVAAYLQSKNVPFQRGSGKVDSAQVPAPVLKQILSLPAGEPFVIPSPQGAVANVITNRQPAPLPPEQAQPLAVQMIRAEALDKVLQQRLKDAQAKAKITYQPGFGPAPSTPSATGTPKI